MVIRKQGMNALNFLYPETEKYEDKTLCMNKGIFFEKNVSARDDIFIKKYGFRIPNNTCNYEDFFIKIKANERDFSNVLNYLRERNL